MNNYKTICPHCGEVIVLTKPLKPIVYLCDACKEKKEGKRLYGS